VPAWSGPAVFVDPGFDFVAGELAEGSGRAAEPDVPDGEAQTDARGRTQLRRRIDSADGEDGSGSLHEPGETMPDRGADAADAPGQRDRDDGKAPRTDQDIGGADDPERLFGGDDREAFEPDSGCGES